MYTILEMELNLISICPDFRYFEADYNDYPAILAEYNILVKEFTAKRRELEILAEEGCEEEQYDYDGSRSCGEGSEYCENCQAGKDLGWL
jgi:hypothetical protein